MIRSSLSPQAKGYAKVEQTARPRALAKGISQGHYKDRGPVEPRPNQTQDSLLNGAYSARTPGVASVRSRNLSQLEFIFLAIAFSSARFSRATSAVCSSPAFLARRSKSS
jgi:hypothetical protein